jgi:6-pyruvoyltetrahydropterin/6-carboxytetrahydropterin synthase
MLTSCPSAGKTVGRVRTSKIRPGFKKPLRPIFSGAPPYLAELLFCTPPLSSPAELLRVRYLTLNMPRVTVTRRLRFNAAHRVHNPALSEAENSRLFGKCNNPNWHGHNYTLDVSVEGDIDPKTGYVCDLSHLKKIVETEIIDIVDHKNFNLDVPFMRNVIPTSENIVAEFWKMLAPRVKPGKLSRLVLWETENNYVEYTGH